MPTLDEQARHCAEIIKRGGCSGLRCYNCPGGRCLTTGWASGCNVSNDPVMVASARAWLADHRYTSAAINGTK